METLTETSASVTSKVIMVTPELAEKWLSKNTKNRPLRDEKIDFWLSTMKKGQWTIATDSIGFDINGNLCNGQHRLHALIKYGKALPFNIMRGLPLESFNAIDTGTMRTAGDVLGGQGILASRSKAAIIVFLIYSKDGIKTGGGGPSAKRITHQDALDFYKKNKARVEEAHEASIMYTKKFKAINAKYIGALYYIFSKIDRDCAIRFFELYNSGLDLKIGSPVLTLREKLILDLNSSKKYHTSAKIAWIVLCWNSYHAGRTMKTIRHSEITEMPIPQ